MSPWTAADIPDQTGRTAVVTGGNAGLGWEVASGLARAGARVLLACRDLDRAADAVSRLRAELGGAVRVEVVRVDLADLGSVRAGAAEVAARTDGLDLLVANAGIMATPLRRSADSFELQLATNHLGHFALGGLLLPLLAARPHPRVVAVSSVMHQIGRLDLQDLHWRVRRYRRWQAYGDSKLANLLWVAELQRRSTAAGLALRAVAAHPGYADTGLQARAPRMAGSRLGSVLAAGANQLVAQPAAMGALPLLYAATMPDVGAGTSSALMAGGSCAVTPAGSTPGPRRTIPSWHGNCGAAQSWTPGCATRCRVRRDRSRPSLVPMPQEPPPSAWAFPPPEQAGPDGLLGVGADLEPGTLLSAYRVGVFPMPLGRSSPVGWWSPDPRGVVPLHALRVSRSLRASTRRFEVRVDTAFAEVLDRCADRRRPGGWITAAMRAAYLRLHGLGWAHSVEAWSPHGGLAGGLYGVSMGGLFAGESMFHVPAPWGRDASKVALVALVDLLRADGHQRLLDVQWCTPHLASLGAVELSRREYLRRLRWALTLPSPPALG